MEVSNDEAILNFIFNPAAGLNVVAPPPSSAPAAASASTSASEKTTSSSGGDEPLIKAKKLEIEGVRLAEQQKVEEAIDVFTQAVNLVPDYASAYNNRYSSR
jgi:hypothetical protein